MSQLKAAREQGFSDEEIVKHLSETEDGWLDKYREAKDAGYSDSEILETDDQSKIRKQQASTQEEAPQVEGDQVPEDQYSPARFARNLGQNIGGAASQALEDTAGMVKGAASGVTWGASEYIPGMGFSDEERANMSTTVKGAELLGEMRSLGFAGKYIKPGAKMALKFAGESPVGKAALGFFGGLTDSFFLGAGHKGTKDVIKGEMPSPSEMIEEGQTWALLHAGISALGATYQFSKNIASTMEETGQSATEVIKDAWKYAMDSGIDPSESKAVAEKAMEFFETKKPLAKDAVKVSAEEAAIRTSGEEALESKYPRLPSNKQGGKPNLETPPRESISKPKRMPEPLPEFETPKAAEPDPLVSHPEDFPSQDPVHPSNVKAREPGKKIPKEEQKRFTKKESPGAEVKPPEVRIGDVAPKPETPKPETVANIAKNRKQQYKKNTDKILDEEVAPRVKTEKKLGEGAQKSIQSELEAAEKEAERLYKSPNKKAEVTKVSNSEDVLELWDDYQKFTRLKTKPKDYKLVENTYETLIEDLGGTLTRDPKTGKKILSGISETTLAARMEAGQRLSKIANFDIRMPSVRGKLKHIGGKQSERTEKILEGLKDKTIKPEWEAAQKHYAEMSEKFGNDPIMDIRKQVRPEKVVGELSSPTTLEKLQKALPEKEYAKIEREVLEGIRGSNHEKASKTYREVQEYLSPKSKALAEEIISFKDSNSLARDTFDLGTDTIKNMKSSFLKGDKPKQALEMWGNKQGQKVIKETLKGHPEGAEIIKYLEDQSFHDFIADVFKDGPINFKTLNRLSRNPESKKKLLLLGGEDAVKAFTQTEQIMQKFEKNVAAAQKAQTQQAKRLKAIEQPPLQTPSKKPEAGRETRLSDQNKIGRERIRKQAERNKKVAETKAAEVEAAKTNVDKFHDWLNKGGDSYSKDFRKLLYSFGGLGKFGFSYAVAGKAGAAAYGAKVLFNLARKPSVMKAFKKTMTDPSALSPESAKKLIIMINKSMEEPKPPKKKR